jgi:hypothetical protein
MSLLSGVQMRGVTANDDAQRREAKRRGGEMTNVISTA